MEFQETNKTISKKNNFFVENKNYFISENLYLKTVCFETVFLKKITFFRKRPVLFSKNNL